MPQGSQLMIVDDDRDIRETLREILEDEGYSVSTAGNGREALQFLRYGVVPELILLDLMMPVMSGWEFRDEQLGDPRLAPIPVVVLSATPDVHQTAAALGAASWVRKPFEMGEVIEVLSSLITPA